MPITEHVVSGTDHTTFYLADGPDGEPDGKPVGEPERGPAIIFVHGWPELSISWRHQLPVFARLGFRAIAPDMRGYGNSSVYDRHEDYAQALIVADMIALLDALELDKAVWVGHDWGSPVVWNIAAHHPDRCSAIVNLCVPYHTLEHGVDRTIDLVDRKIYPEDTYPAGQWDYQLYYQESFGDATRSMQLDTYNTVKLLFRKGNPDGVGKPAGTATTRQRGGWFGGGGALDLPRDAAVVTEQDLRIYTAALMRNGFFGPNSYYMNHEANAEYARANGDLEMPVLFVGARYDYVCETATSALAQPMRASCSDLSEAIVDSGHWMAQEKPREVNALVAGWLARKVPELWPFADLLRNL